MSDRTQLVENKNISLGSICKNKGLNENYLETFEIKANDLNTDLHKLQQIRNSHVNKPMIGYLNINSLRNKIHEVREVFGDLLLDYFVIAETKLNDEFPNSQFIIRNYEICNRRDRTKNGGGLIVYVRKGLNIKLWKSFKQKFQSQFFSK